MANEKEDSDIDDSLSMWQKFKAGFAGDASAQMARKRQMMYQNKQDQELSNQNAADPNQGEALRRVMQNK